MIDKTLTKHLAQLSQIYLTDDELQTMTEQMTDIIMLMDKVRVFNASMDTYTLEPVSYSDLRDDTALPSFDTEAIIKNAKSIKNNSFVVPKII